MELLVLSILFIVGFTADILLTKYFIDTFSKQQDLKNTLINNAILAVNKRIDSIFVIDKPSPNDATKADDTSIEFSETNPLNLPADLKIEVEGGDTTTPPGFKAQK